MPTYGSSAVVSHKDLPIQHVSSTQWGDMHYRNRKDIYYDLGRVGIGTSIPSYDLEVKNLNDPHLGTIKAGMYIGDICGNVGWTKLNDLSVNEIQCNKFIANLQTFTNTTFSNVVVSTVIDVSHIRANTLLLDASIVNIQTANLDICDNLIGLAYGRKTLPSANNYDAGMLIERGNDASNAFIGFKEFGKEMFAIGYTQEEASFNGWFKTDVPNKNFTPGILYGDISGHNTSYFEDISASHIYVTGDICANDVYSSKIIFSNPSLANPASIRSGNKKNSIAMGGELTAADGSYSLAFGHNTHANNIYSIAMGNNAIAGERNSIALGTHMRMNVSGGVALGRFNITENSANNIFVIGAGTSSTLTRDAFYIRVDGSGVIEGNFEASGGKFIGDISAISTSYFTDISARNIYFTGDISGRDASFQNLTVNGVSIADSGLWKKTIGTDISYTLGKVIVNDICGGDASFSNIYFTGDISGHDASFQNLTVNGVNITGSGGGGGGSSLWTLVDGVDISYYTGEVNVRDLSCIDGSFTNLTVNGVNITGNGGSGSGGSSLWTQVNGVDISYYTGEVNVKDLSCIDGSFTNLETFYFESALSTSIAFDGEISGGHGKFNNLTTQQMTITNASNLKIDGKLIVGGDASFQNLTVNEINAPIDASMIFNGDLSVNGNIFSLGGAVGGGGGGGGGLWTQMQNTDISYEGNVFVDGDICGTGDIVGFYSSSDIRLKTNIETILNPMDIISELRGVRFNWNETAKGINPNLSLTKKEIGVIAQEIEELLPEVIRPGLHNYKAVRYENITGLLIEGLREQKTQIEGMDSQIQGMTSKIERMDSQIQGMASQIQGMASQIQEMASQI